MQSPGSYLRILVVRVDNIGDVILSTPVFEVLKRHFPRSKITVMVRETVAPLLVGLSGIDEVMIYDPNGIHGGFRGFFRLIADIRLRSFKIAIVLQSNRRIAAAIFWSVVKHRIGPLSKLHSFIFYNRGVRQRRSEVEMHEADYNLQLLRRLGIRIGTRNVPVKVSVSEEAKIRAAKWLKNNGWDTDLKQTSQLVVIHPGMRGSALNWPEKNYVELAAKLLEEKRAVLITAGPAEGELLRRFQEQIKRLLKPDNLMSPMYFGGDNAGSIADLAAIIDFANLVVAPSTGPMHLAVALKKRVVTFFSPIRVQSALRWGPYLSDETRSSVLVPEVYCGQDFVCRENRCNYYPCMKSISVAQALEHINKHLAKESAAL